MNNLDVLADLALAAKIAKEEAEERYNDALNDLRIAAQEQGKLDSSLKAAGNTRITVSPNRYFDSSVAQSMVTKKVLKECEVTKVDNEKLKQHLTPIQLEEAMKTYNNPWKISLKPLED